jgi:PAS domain S-box-containing protein
MSKRKDIVPTEKEIVMRDDEFIVSKTDVKGRITYVNQVFIDFSGYTEDELIGIQHNVIRHPEMPRGVFKLLWSAIADGQEIFAYVKNMCKDGSYYWVLANITPSVDVNGATVGYYSVRRKANPRAIPIVTDLYRKMLAAERQAGARNATAASLDLMQQVINEKGLNYEEFVLSLQSI